MAVAPHQGSDPRVNALVPLTTAIDDPTNTQGLGAPAIIRGSVYGHLAAGVTLGAGQTTAVQTATFNGLQAALNKSISWNKFFVLEPNTYEIYGSTGLVVSTSGSHNWIGSKQSLLSQFYANAPILVIGDTTNATTVYQSHFDGVGLQYGVSQSGNTNANALVFGPTAWSVFENILISNTNGSYPLINPAYNAMQMIYGGTWFNNTMRNVRLYGAQNSLFLLAANGSGNLFEDVYISNGGNSNASPTVYGALSGPALFVGNSSYGTVNGNVWVRLNIESVKCAQVMVLQEAKVNAFYGLHLENLQINAANGCLINNNSSSLVIEDFDIYDLQIPASMGTCNGIYNNGAGEIVTINGLSINWSYNSNPGLNSPLTLFSSGGNNDQNANFTVRGIQVNESTTNNTPNLTLYNGNYPLTYSGATTYTTQVVEFSSDQVSVRTLGYQPCIITTTYTHYGLHVDATLMLPASLSAASTITLSNKRWASGLGSSLATVTGNTVRIRRTSGTYANTLTIKDAASGNTLATNSASATDYLFQFNGTNWVAAT